MNTRPGFHFSCTWKYSIISNAARQFFLFSCLAIPVLPGSGSEARPHPLPTSVLPTHSRRTYVTTHFYLQMCSSSRVLRLWFPASQTLWWLPDLSRLRQPPPDPQCFFPSAFWIPRSILVCVRGYKQLPQPGQLAPLGVFLIAFKTEALGKWL